MLVRKYLTGAEWLNNIMIILLYHVTAEFFAGLFRSRMGIAFIAIAAVIVICSYLCRVYIEKLPFYLLAHVLMLAAAVFCPMVFKYRLAAFVMVVVLSICDILFWTGGSDRSFIHVHPVLSLIFAAVFIHASVNGAEYPARVSYICGICFLSVYFLRTYLMNGARFASGMLINKNTPIDDMFRHNSRIVFPLVGCFCVGMFLLQSDTLALALSAVVRMIINGIGRFVFWILSLIPKGGGSETTFVSQKGHPELLPSAPLPAWLIALFSAVEKTVSILIIGFFIWLLIRITVRFFKTYFNRHGYEILEVDHDDHTEIREKIKHDRKERRGRIFGSFSEKERIRRRYRTVVLKMCRRGYLLRRCHTPAERMRDVLASYKGRETEGFEELSGEYEKVRYLR
ncbi:MAG: hypothetical protein K6E88_07290 [Lachnospiraceae bacterium]|nr:hypothetical protein [Lachnospiraceae bacterium]